MKPLSDVGDAILTNSLGSLSQMLVKIDPSVTHCTAILWSGFDFRIRSDRTDICTAQYYDSHLTLRWIFYPPRCMKRCRHTVCWSPYRCLNPPPPCCMSTPGGLRHLFSWLPTPSRDVDPFPLSLDSIVSLRKLLFWELMKRISVQL